MRDLADAPSHGDADIAVLASLLAEPARCQVLLSLTTAVPCQPACWPTRRG
jgi:hypothetical protein